MTGGGWGGGVPPKTKGTSNPDPFEERDSYASKLEKSSLSLTSHARLNFFSGHTYLRPRDWGGGSDMKPWCRGENHELENGLWVGGWGRMGRVFPFTETQGRHFRKYAVLPISIFSIIYPSPTLTLISPFLPRILSPPSPSPSLSLNLSPRLLDYTSIGLTKTCREQDLTDRPRVGTGKDYFHVYLASILDHEPGRKKINYSKVLKAWDTVLGLYMVRLLTDGQDMLLALDGLAKQFQKHLDSEDISGLWREYLPQGLPAAMVWTSGLQTNTSPKGTPVIRQITRSRPPSWSWASVEGPLCSENGETFDQGYDESSHKIEITLRVLQCKVTLANLILPFGQVTGGMFQVNGYIRDVICRPSSNQETELEVGSIRLNIKPYDFGEWSAALKSTTISRPEIVRHNEVTESDPNLRMFWEGFDAVCSEGLMLVKAPNGRYRHLGYFKEIEMEQHNYLFEKSLRMRVMIEWMILHQVSLHHRIYRPSTDFQPKKAIIQSPCLRKCIFQHGRKSSIQHQSRKISRTIKVLHLDSQNVAQHNQLTMAHPKTHDEFDSIYHYATLPKAKFQGPTEFCDRMDLPYCKEDVSRNFGVSQGEDNEMLHERSISPTFRRRHNDPNQEETRPRNHIIVSPWKIREMERVLVEEGIEARALTGSNWVTKRKLTIVVALFNKFWKSWNFTNCVACRKALVKSKNSLRI